MLKNGITLVEGERDQGYFLVHDDDRYIYIQSECDIPSLAMTFGWSPCAKCRKTCRGATDGMISCPRRTASEHLLKAYEWLDDHCGMRVASDPGYFEPIEPAFNHDLVRAIFALASNYHSGQWSRGYRVLCRIKKYAERHGVNLEVKTRASQQLFRRLVKRYADKL